MLTNPATWYKMPSSLFLLSPRTPQGGLFWSQRASGDISLWHKSLFGRGREFTCIRERGGYAGCTWRVDFNIFCCVSFSSSDYKNCVMKTYHTLQRNSSLFHRSQISKIIFWAKALNSKGQWLHGWFWFSPWASEGSMRWRRKNVENVLGSGFQRWVTSGCCSILGENLLYRSGFKVVLKWPPSGLQVVP